VIDAAADRYVELGLFAGLAIHLRMHPNALLLALAAMSGSFMVSYSTSKAESLGVVPPRGSMRRTERGFLLVVGATLTPLTSALGAPPPWTEAPLLLALLWLAVGTHFSAVARFCHLVRELRARDGQSSIHAEDIADTLPVDR
jgi:phosphatidylglycerophosphate synthase